MRMKRTVILLLGILALAACGKQSAEPLSVRMVRSEMSRCPDGTYLDFCEGKINWNYTPGLEMKAFLDVYETYGGEDILKYVDDWYGLCIEDDGHVTYYYKGDYTVDKVCPARTMYQLYDDTGKEIKSICHSIEDRLESRHSHLQAVHQFLVALNGFYDLGENSYKSR